MDTSRHRCLAILIAGILFVVMPMNGKPLASEGSGLVVGNIQEVPDTTMKLLGGEDGTLFESLKVEGEDRIRIEFERPELILNLDPKTTQGLEWESIHSILNQLGVNLMTPFLNQSAGLRRQCFARPWLDQFSSNGVARFRPELKGVERWQLMVADSKGNTVARFEGKGKTPDEIIWDGRSMDGDPVPPGLTYSYVLEAYDRAGNKRNFVGDGFELQSYRIDTPEGRMMLFSGSDLSESKSSAYGKISLPPAVLLDVANFINQESNLDAPVHIEVTARSFEAAHKLAGDIVLMLKPFLLGNVIRVQPATKVQPDAPDRGTVVVLLPRQ